MGPVTGVNLLVSQELCGAGEALSALLALVGLVTRMGSLMAGKLRAAPEAFAALLTLVGLLPSVDTLMAEKVRVGDEAFPALLTLVGLLPGVCHLVQGELGGAAVHLVALLALEAPRAGVGEQVEAELGVVAEGLAALLTFVGLLPSVDALVPQQVRGAHEGLPALLALEALLVGVNSLVEAELGVGREGLPALLTLVGLLTRMQLLMVTELGGRVEGLPALLALMWLLTTLRALRLQGVRPTSRGAFLTLTFSSAFGGPRTHGHVRRAAGGLGALCMLTGLCLTMNLRRVNARRLAPGRFLTFLTAAGFSSRVSLPMGCALGGTWPRDRSYRSLSRVSLLMDLLTLQLARDFAVTPGPAVLKAGACTFFCHLLLQCFHFGSGLWKEAPGFCPRLPVCKTVRKWNVSFTLQEGLCSK